MKELSLQDMYVGNTVISFFFFFGLKNALLIKVYFLEFPLYSLLIVSLIPLIFIAIIVFNVHVSHY